MQAWVRLSLILSLMMVTLQVVHGQDFVNWESPQVSPLAMMPDGTRLVAVNTADNRLEVLTLDAGLVNWAYSIPVGLDPVSVCPLDETTAWVINHISDSISIVDIDAGCVVDTILTGDEPADVVFAGDPLRAFVSISQLNEVHVYDPFDLAVPAVVLPIAGEDPRALATDGINVWAAIFESGNRTTLVRREDVSSPLSPYPDDPNPPPNSGLDFDPPLAPDLPSAPPAGMIVRRDGSGAWRDVNGEDWSAAIGWDLHDHDVAIINADSLAVSYESGLMTLVMGLATTGDGVVAVGTESLNEIRFEPNLNGRFSRVVGVTIDNGGTGAVTDLNPHLDYTSPMVEQSTRDLSLGDPRGVAWADGRAEIAIAGLGSNNVIVTDEALQVLDRIEVGEGPTGIVYDAAADRYYVLNRFEGSVSVVDAARRVELSRTEFFDPTPDVIRIGRPHIFDTHRTSGLGHVSCASCHVDTKMDQIAWDLGDPTGSMKAFDQGCFGGGCEDWHPVKGPLMTQSLVGIIGTGPLHWRGDRGDLTQFNVAFQSLLGDDEQLTASEMQELVDYIATTTYPPNPFRTLQNGLATTLENGGDAVNGENLFKFAALDGFNCDVCHTPPTGTNGGVVSGFLLDTSVQSIKNPQLRNLYEKVGFDPESQDNGRGFGFVHDGSVPSIFDFLLSPRFDFSPGPTGDQERRDVEAFLLSFAVETPAGVGAQATIGGSLDQTARRDMLISIADDGEVELIVKGTWNDEDRGFVYIGSEQFQSDRTAQTVDLADLDFGAGPGAELTFTLVPFGSGTRMGVDRDRDGFFDRDERDLCTDPADPTHFPGSGSPPVSPCDVCRADLDANDAVDVLDLLTLIGQWGVCAEFCTGDLDNDGSVGVLDLLDLLGSWGACPDGTG